MGSFSSKTKTKSQSTTTTAPNAQYQPYTDQAIGDVKKIYDNNQSLFNSIGGKAMDVYNGLGPAASALGDIYTGNGPGAATYNNMQHASANDTSIPILTQLAQGSKSPGDYSGIGDGNPALGILQGMTNGQVNGDTDQYYKDVIGGKYLDNNPYIDAIAKQGQDAALKAVNQRFAASGMGEGLSTPYAQAAGDSITNANNTLRYQNYSDERGRQNQVAGMSDAMYNATKDRNLSAATGYGSLFNQTGALKLNAQQAKDQAFNADRTNQLAAADRLGSQNNANNATSLSAANAQVQSILSALGLAPGMADEQLKSLTVGSMLPFVGASNYANLINSLTGRYSTTNSNSTSTTKSTPSVLSDIGQAVNIGTDLASMFAPVPKK